MKTLVCLATLAALLGCGNPEAASSAAAPAKPPAPTRGPSQAPVAPANGG